MSESQGQPVSPSPVPPASGPRDAWATPARWIALLAALCVAAGAGAYFYSSSPMRLGPAQPIAFSHHLHASAKQISCLLCHTGVVNGTRAGIPPLETCMLCHRNIIITYPQIVTLREHYEKGVPLAWKRVNQLPEFVYFTHTMHVRAGIDCGRCHGDIRGMDRVTLFQDFQMGFCVQCHRDYGVSIDCLTCHR